METRSFTQLINRAIANGASKVEVRRSEGYCGCAKPGDIIEVIAYKDSWYKDGFYSCMRASLRHAFDNPTINVEVLWRRTDDNKCIDSTDVKEYVYTA